MKKIIALTASVALAGIASQASAQAAVSGTVVLTGNVAGRCAIVAPGGTAGQSINETINLGQLDEDDGTLRSNLDGSTALAPGASYSTRVVCTSANVDIDVAADTLALSDVRGVTPASGYANEIDYTADLVVALAAGGNGQVSFNTASNNAAVGATVGRLAAGGSNNVIVRAHSFDTRGGPSSLLSAGDYKSTITVNIKPVV